MRILGQANKDLEITMTKMSRKTRKEGKNKWNMVNSPRELNLLKILLIK